MDVVTERYKGTTHKQFPPWYNIFEGLWAFMKRVKNFLLPLLLLHHLMLFIKKN